MRYGFINNFSQTLAAALAPGATTLQLSAGGEAFAGASSNYRFKLTLVQRDAFGNETHREIVDVTGSSGNELAIAGEQEGTTRPAGGWPSGSEIAARVTAGQLAGFSPEVIAFGPVDFSDPNSSASWQAPPGRKLFVDAIEVVPLASAQSGELEVVSGTPILASRALALSYNDDETLLAAAHWNAPAFTVMDTSDWSVVAGTPALTGSGYGASFSPDGALLAVIYSGASPYLKVFNTNDWSEVSGTPTLSGIVYGGIEFSPDGTWLAVGNVFGEGVKIVNTSTWEVDHTLSAIAADCNDLKWSPDGSQLAVVHDAPGLKVYETSTWTELFSDTLPADVYRLAYSPAGDLLAMGYDGDDDQIHLFDTSTWTDTASAMSFARSDLASIDWMPGGDQIVFGDSPFVGSGQIAVVNVADWSLASSFSAAGGVPEVLVNSAGDVIAAGTSASPFLVVGAVAAYPAPTLNLGESLAAPSDILAAASLDAFDTFRRIVVPANHAKGVSTLYAEPAQATQAGAPATLIVRGYTLEG